MISSLRYRRGLVKKISKELYESILYQTFHELVLGRPKIGTFRFTSITRLYTCVVYKLVWWGGVGPYDILHAINSAEGHSHYSRLSVRRVGWCRSHTLYITHVDDLLTHTPTTLLLRDPGTSFRAELLIICYCWSLLSL